MESTARRTGPRPATLRRIDPWLGPVSVVLLACAVGFFLIAMPPGVLAALVAAIGLPPAVAGSPVALALVVALLTGTATWAAFDLIDRAGRTRRKPPLAVVAVPAPNAPAAPVLRRTDAHPDAPARRPIFAASDLGTPLDLIDPLPADDGAPPPVSSPPAIDPGRAEKALASDPPPLPALSYPTVSAAPGRTVALAQPPPSLAGMISRLEVGLARKALALGEGDTNVTPLKREITPFRGDMGAALDEIHEQTARSP